jgi:hypothetical protein
MSDWCMLDGRCFLRGSIRTPIRGEDRDFVWVVWVEVRRYVFERYLIAQAEEGPSTEPPYEGTLANSLPSYSNTVGLRMRMEFTGDLKRPQFTVIQQDHPLALDQREGIEFERVLELMSPIWHPGG